MTAEIVVFDTEFTAWAGSIARNWKGPGEHREIVQIGAVVVGAKEMDEKASFSVLIKPVQNPILSGYFEQLTRISNAQVQAEGVDFATGVQHFIAFAGTRPTFCYGRDDLIIAENAALLGMPRLWTPAASVNLRVWLGEVGVPLAGVHAGDLAAHVGAKARGLAHDALTDARSLVEAVRYLVARGAPNPFAAAAPGPS
jgi:inhibitor of KinA sporulation pathway (predicted exonuclease)